VEFFDVAQPTPRYVDDCVLCDLFRPIDFPACYQHRSKDEWSWMYAWERFYQRGFCLINVQRIERERSTRSPTLF